jgi:glutamate-1-semialdehyde 2,1-aminomutase
MQLVRARSEQLYQEALSLFPGGVNSPVRAFRSVGGTPLFFTRGQGAEVFDADDNRYIDLCHSWGPLILGHAHPAITEAITRTAAKGSTFGAPTKEENDLAAFVLQRIPFVERIRFVSSGTEAVMSAIRLARGATGRDLIIKFDGCYHGHTDSLLVNAGSGLATLGTSSSAGVPSALAQLTIVLPLNDEDALHSAFQRYGERIAGAIVEPIPANNGLLLQRGTFLEGLRALCTKHGSVLIFDEVISGFRVGFAGSFCINGIVPDLVTYGKILGGGMPVGAYGGKRWLMEHVAPMGKVYQAGTLSGNPVAMAAGLAQLRECTAPGFYQGLLERTAAFCGAVRSHCTERGYQYQMSHVGSIFWGCFGAQGTVRSAGDINGQAMGLYARLHAALLARGVYAAPSGYEVGFVSAAHTQAHLEKVTTAWCSALDETFS